MRERFSRSGMRRLRRSAAVLLLFATTLVVAPSGVSAQDDLRDAPGRVELVNLEFGRYLEVQPNINVYTSNQSNTATEFILHPVDGLDDTYLIQSVSTGLYVHGHGEGGASTSM